MHTMTVTHQKEVLALQQTIKAMTLEGTPDKLIETSRFDKKIEIGPPTKEADNKGLIQDSVFSFKESHNNNASPQSHEPYSVKTINKLNKKITELITELETLKIEKKSNESHLNSLLQEKFSLENTNNLIRERSESLENERRRLEEENANLKGSNKFLESRNEVHVKESEALRWKCEGLEKENRRLELEVHEKNINEMLSNKKNNFVSSAYEQEFTKEKQVSNSNQETPYMLKTVNKLNKKIESLQAEIEILKQENKTLQTQEENIIFEKLNLDSANKVFRERIDNLDKEKKSVEEELLNLKANKLYLQERNDEKLKEIEILKEKLSNLEKSQQPIQENDVRNEIEKLKIEVIEKNFRIKSLEADLNNIKTEKLHQNQENYLKLKEKFLTLQENFLIVSALNQAFMEEKTQKSNKSLSFENKSVQVESQKPISISLKTTQVCERDLTNFFSKQTQINEKDFLEKEETPKKIPNISSTQKSKSKSTQVEVAFSQKSTQIDSISTSQKSTQVSEKDFSGFVLQIKDKEEKVENKIEKGAVLIKSTQVFERDLVPYQSKQTQIEEHDFIEKKLNEKIFPIEELYQKFKISRDLNEKLILLNQVFFFLYKFLDRNNK